MSETTHDGSVRRGPLIAIYIAAAVCGYFLGARGLLRSTGERTANDADALARVGIALHDESPHADPASWTSLGADIATARGTFSSPQRETFDLVMAVRGLENGGQPEWSRAEQQCRALGWTRCDRATLEELRKRSRP